MSKDSTHTRNAIKVSQKGRKGPSLKHLKRRAPAEPSVDSDSEANNTSKRCKRSRKSIQITEKVEESIVIEEETELEKSEDDENAASDCDGLARPNDSDVS
jgi:hypothetical protein